MYTHRRTHRLVCVAGCGSEDISSAALTQTFGKKQHPVGASSRVHPSSAVWYRRARAQMHTKKTHTTYLHINTRAHKARNWLPYSQPAEIHGAPGLWSFLANKRLTNDLTTETCVNDSFSLFYDVCQVLASHCAAHSFCKELCVHSLCRTQSCQEIRLNEQ